MSLDKYEISEAGRHRTFCNRVRHFTPDELGAEPAEAGSGAAEILGDLAGAPSFAAVATTGRR
ncbi:hypothetical protein ACL02R_27150 [Streptomyces sp. MS19]|uniref:hypothetical protein n=1 Tax=Streptomyces sp. MS19 TaxID=3385972 RepID=UPI0039A3F14F